MLCDHLEGWDREDGREGDARGKRYGDICICIYFESNFLKIQNHSSFFKSQFLSPVPVVLHIPAPNNIFEINNGSTMILKTKKQNLS